MTAVADETAAKLPLQALAASAGPWWKPLAGTASVAIIHVDLRPDTVHEWEAFGWLDSEERAAWQRYLPDPRRRFSLCRAALRAILCDYLGCTNERLSFATSDHGKPFAVVAGERSGVAFNVSHSISHGLIALAPSGRLGIDVEERVPKQSLDVLIESVMGAEEQSQLASLEGHEKLELFYRFWTFKEALIKALGTGFSTDPSLFQLPCSIRRGDKSGVFRFPHLPGTAWGLEDLSTEEYAAALAYELPLGQPSPSSGAHFDSTPLPQEA